MFAYFSFEQYHRKGIKTEITFLKFILFYHPQNSAPRVAFKAVPTASLEGMDASGTWGGLQLETM